MVYRIIKNEVPKYLCNYFSRIRNTHSYSTRRSATDLVFRFRSCMGKGSFLYSAAVLWNGLPASMKTIFSLVSFKTALKKWLRNGQSQGYLLWCLFYRLLWNVYWYEFWMCDWNVMFYELWMCDWNVIFCFVPTLSCTLHSTHTLHLSTCWRYKGTIMEICPWAFLCHPFDRMYICALAFVHVCQ